MSRWIQILILGIVVVGCKEISFREPQPKDKKELREVPKNLRGKYLAQREDGELASDTIVITEKGYRFIYANPLEQSMPSRNDEGNLGDSLILKYFRNYYFINYNNDPEWILRVISREKNGDLIYMAPEQEGVDFKDYVVKLGRQIRIDSTNVKGKMIYQIDPSPEKLIDLIEKGYFSRTLLKKVPVRD